MLALLLVAAGCSAISGPCTREITTTTHCDSGGTVIVFPSPQ